MEGWGIIQQCELAPHTGLYGKRLFISAINELTTDQFNKFCREYLHLVEYYSRTQGAWVTDYTPLVEANPTLFWQLTPIEISIPLLHLLVSNENASQHNTNESRTRLFAFQ